MVPLMLHDNLYFTVTKPGLMAFLTNHMIRSAMNAETAFYVGISTSMIANIHHICQGSLVSPVSKDRDFMKVILLYAAMRLHSVITQYYLHHRTPETYLHTLLMSEPVYPSSLSAITLLSKESSTVTPSRHSFNSAERVSAVRHTGAYVTLF